MIELPKKGYSQDLLHWIYSIDVDDSDEAEYELLKKVCTCYLYNGEHDFQIDRVQISEEEKSLIQERDYIHANNDEIRARFLDVALRYRLYIKEKLDLKRLCSDLYMSIAEEQHDCFAFIRSIQVRNVRFLWDEIFVTKLIDVVSNEDFSPLWINCIIERIKLNLEKESCAIKELLIIYENRANNDKVDDFDWQLHYVDFLLKLEVINDTEAHFRKAIVHETDGDYLNSNKEENTFYPNLHQKFQEAFNEINVVKKTFPHDWERIRKKLVVQKKDFVRMLSIAGVHTKYELSRKFQSQVRSLLEPQMNFENPLDVLFLLMNAPFFSADEKIVEKQRLRFSEQNVMYAICSNMEHINLEGNTVGINKNDAGFCVMAHRHMRLHLLFYLWTIVEHFHCLRLLLNEEKVWGLLLSKHSTLVNDDQLLLWSKGICSVLNGEPLLGSYILMPQIESIIRQIAENKLGDLTRLSEELQFEPTLGGILEKLKPRMPETMNDELRFFFVDGCDLNLRNEMLHGLIDNPMQVQKHSVYLLYVALNLFFKEDKFLQIN